MSIERPEQLEMIEKTENKADNFNEKFDKLNDGEKKGILSSIGEKIQTLNPFNKEKAEKDINTYNKNIEDKSDMLSKVENPNMKKFMGKLESRNMVS